MRPVPNLLIELLSEEIPARMQRRAVEDLQAGLLRRLEAADLTPTAASAYVTPRRLALHLEGLPARQPDVSEERKGPKLGAPAQALEGFLKANGLTSLEQAELRETPKGSFYFAVRQIAGRPTPEVVAETLEAALLGFVWPKSMRWGRHRFRWVRPLRGVLAVFDGRPLTGALDLGAEKLVFGNTTLGHRFLGPKPFRVTTFADYTAGLLRGKVLLDQDERRRSIVEQCSALAHGAGLAVKPDPGLLEEVTGLVEWPVVLMGKIDERFMALPPEVLSTSMRSHQKYFSLIQPDGALAARFLVVSNMLAPEASQQRANIVAGNERVLRARLSDAEFFWEQDRSTSLESRLGKLKDMVFHAKLGSLEAKVDRVEALALAIAARVPGAERDHVRSAARLAKADLTTGMVGEFPELQGVMGRYYALHDGEAPAVAAAVAEHYAPLGPTEPCPSAPVSIAVALADKLDTLAGFWSIGENPTGSKDPFALRRAALGVIRLILENRLRLPLLEVFGAAFAGYGAKDAALADDLLGFLAERLKVSLRDRGVRHDLISAVFALGGEDDLVRLLARVEALDAFLASDDGANLLVAYRRAANIVRIESKRDGHGFAGDISVGALEQPEEVQFFTALEQAAAAAAAALDGEEFGAAMAALAQLRQPVDAFFDAVTVNAEVAALRENRLKLLARIGATLSQVADFDLIEGQQGESSSN